MILVTLNFNIVDPLDDPSTFKFAEKALKKKYGKNITVKRTDFNMDFFEAIDLVVIIMPENKNIQVKSSYFETDDPNNLKVHLAYETNNKKPCAFDLYDERQLDNFLFIWPNSGFAFITEFYATMALWQRYHKTWKKNNRFCDNGCYVSLKVRYLARLLTGDNYSFYEIN